MTIYVKRYKELLDWAKANPSGYDGCGYGYSFSRQAQIKSGKSPDDQTRSRDARLWLGLSHSDASYIFQPHRTIGDLEDFLEYAVMRHVARYVVLLAVVVGVVIASTWWLS